MLFHIWLLSNWDFPAWLISDIHNTHISSWENIVILLPWAEHPFEVDFWHLSKCPKSPIHLHSSTYTKGFVIVVNCFVSLSLNGVIYILNSAGSSANLPSAASDNPVASPTTSTGTSASKCSHWNLSCCLLSVNCLMTCKFMFDNSTGIVNEG